MNRIAHLVLVAATLLAVACADVTPPPPAVTPQGEDRFLIDPRTGFTNADPAIDRKFDTAWRFVLVGDVAEARRRLADLRTRNPEYLPAALAEAALQIKEGNLAQARTTVQRIEDQAPDYIAPRVYEAEIALAEHRTRAAYDLYRALASRPDAPPTAAERVNMLQGRVFEELFTAAQTAPDDEAIRLLREALTINAGASNARVLLATKLAARRDYDAAREALAPIVNSPDFEKPEVQEVMAEIEAGQGQYEQAITRYERLSRSSRDPRYTRRLEQIKEQWNEANMPPQFQRAYESPAIDRSDLAVLIYWKLASVRFAQNLGSPPIAIDIEGIPGREEIIRAIAIGLYDVDPVTRRVSPLRAVSAASLSRVAARLLGILGANCARGVPNGGDEYSRASRILAACGITDPSANVPADSPVTGRQAAALLDEIDKAVPH